VPVLAVATGRFAAEELRAAGADAVVATLADPAVLEFLLGPA
jgi:phosphoglycolate phosphatase-like HAD superfamily hydrolase